MVNQRGQGCESVWESETLESCYRGYFSSRVGIVLWNNFFSPQIFPQRRSILLSKNYPPNGRIRKLISTRGIYILPKRILREYYGYLKEKQGEKKIFESWAILITLGSVLRWILCNEVSLFWELLEEWLSLLTRLGISNVFGKLRRSVYTSWAVICGVLHAEGRRDSAACKIFVSTANIGEILNHNMIEIFDRQIFE